MSAPFPAAFMLEGAGCDMDLRTGCTCKPLHSAGLRQLPLGFIVEGSGPRVFLLAGLCKPEPALLPIVPGLEPIAAATQVETPAIAARAVTTDNRGTQVLSIYDIL